MSNRVTFGRTKTKNTSLTVDQLEDWQKRNPGDQYYGVDTSIERPDSTYWQLPSELKNAEREATSGIDFPKKGPFYDPKGVDKYEISDIDQKNKTMTLCSNIGKCIVVALSSALIAKLSGAIGGKKTRRNNKNKKKKSKNTRRNKKRN